MTVARNVNWPAEHASPAPSVLVSVVLPCRNEVDGVGPCVTVAISALRDAGLSGEIIVVDNGSSDGSAEQARAAGARVVTEERVGYGTALRAGFDAAEGDYIVMADADGSYDLAQVPLLVAALTEGADLIIGDRMNDIEPGAMPWSHRMLGNPALSGLLRWLFHSQVRDAHCGMRAFRRDVLATLDLRGSGMELASEMVIRARKAGLRVGQIPVPYRRRVGKSKLISLRDGWRHVRLLLVHAPVHLFVLPGAALALLGMIACAVALFEVELFGRPWHVHTMVAGSLLLICGVQLLTLGVCAQTFAAYFMGERRARFDRWRARIHLEQVLAVGAALVLIGGGIAVATVVGWARNGFAELSEELVVVLASTLIVIGVQIMFAGFLVSILGLRRSG